MPISYIYNETDNKYYQKLAAYGEPTEIDDIDLNSQWASDTTDDEYKYFKSASYETGEDVSFSQCKVTWSNLSSITFKYMSNGDMGGLIVLKMDSEKFTLQTSDDDIYLTTFDKTPGTYNEFTIECDEGEHHIWFCYVKDSSGNEGEDRGFIGVPKSVRPVLDVKQGSELPMEYKSGGVSVENGKTYDINFKNVILPNGNNAVTFYEDYTKTEKTITYEYVNLGLPSGTLWATCNIGASSETEDGVLFQWGETSGMSGSLVGKYSNENYSWATYQYCNGSETTLTKYCMNSSYGTVDNRMTLTTQDDAATQIMGGDWRMPTDNDFRELLDNTTNKWVTNFNGSGVNGRKFTSKTNGNYIFFPAAGNCKDGSVGGVGDIGHVWSNKNLSSSSPHKAWELTFGSIYATAIYGWGRYCGIPVRGVRN